MIFYCPCDVIQGQTAQRFISYMTTNKICSPYILVETWKLTEVPIFIAAWMSRILCMDVFIFIYPSPLIQVFDIFKCPHERYWSRTTSRLFHTSSTSSCPSFPFSSYFICECNPSLSLFRYVSLPFYTSPLTVAIVTSLAQRETTQ